MRTLLARFKTRSTALLFHLHLFLLHSLISFVQHDGERHAGVDGKRDGAQCGMAACVLIVRANPYIAWVRVFLNAQPVSSPDAIVRHNDTARMRELDRPLKVLRIGIFIGIDKNQVEWSLCRKEWQRLKRGADADFGAVIHLSLAERFSHH